MATIGTYGALPGTGTAQVTTEKVVWWGRDSMNLYGTNMLIGSTAVDASNTPTTDLRAGLILGKNTSDGKLYPWDLDATNGTEYPVAVLLRDLSMLDSSGAAEDKYGHLIVRGGLIAADLIIGGTNGFVGEAGEYTFRNATVGRFFFDDDFAGELAGGGARYVQQDGGTLTSADSGSTFVSDAVASFTLPAISLGLSFSFIMTADADLTITSAAGNDIVTFNDAAASSVAYSTAGNKIGAQCDVFCVDVAGTPLWVHRTYGAHTVTVT